MGTTIWNGFPLLLVVARGHTRFAKTAHGSFSICAFIIVSSPDHLVSNTLLLLNSEGKKRSIHRDDDILMQEITLNWKSRCCRVSRRRFSDWGKVWVRRCFLGRQSLLMIISEKKNRTRHMSEYMCACMSEFKIWNTASEMLERNHGTHLKSLDTKSRASSETRCWFSGVMNFCHGFLEWRPKIPSK